LWLIKVSTGNKNLAKIEVLFNHIYTDYHQHYTNAWHLLRFEKSYLISIILLFIRPSVLGPKP